MILSLQEQPDTEKNRRGHTGGIGGNSMEEQVVCPDCGQDNVIWQDGEYYCEDCGCRFSPEPKNEAPDAELLSGRTENRIKKKSRASMPVVCG